MMHYHFNVQLTHERDTLSFGERLSRVIKPGTYIYLKGELGAGKTTFTKGFIKGLGYQGLVKSPTYTLVESYPLTRCTLHHLDLYRLDHPETLEFIGIREYFDGKALVLIEWPEMGGNLIPEPDLLIEIKISRENPAGYNAASDTIARSVSITGLSAAIKTQWEAIQHELADLLGFTSSYPKKRP